MNKSAKLHTALKLLSDTNSSSVFEHSFFCFAILYRINLISFYICRLHFTFYSNFVDAAISFGTDMNSHRPIHINSEGRRSSSDV